MTRPQRASALLGALRGHPGLLAASVLAVALVAQASGIPVLQNRDLDSLFAERVTAQLRFEVRETMLDVAPLDLPAVGTPDAPVEIMPVAAPANTAVTAGHWTYAVRILEREPWSAATGEFEVSLAVDGEPRGSVRLVQRVSDAKVREGARITFDIGADRPEMPLFVVTVERVAPPGRDYRLLSITEGLNTPRWRGVGGDIDGRINPDLVGDLDREMTITIENGDGVRHRLQVKQGDEVVAGPTDPIVNPTDTEVLRWIPPAAGEYLYECDYHPGLMEGRIDVT